MKGEEIPLLPSGLWQVTQGIVQLSTIYDDGEQALLGWIDRDGFFGLYSANFLHQCQGIALTDVYVRWLFNNEIESSPRLSQILFPQLLKRLQQSEEMLAINGRRKVEERLQGLLLLLKKDLGEVTTQGTRIKYRFTHQQIASAIGTTRVTITRLMNKLQSENWLIIDSNRHIVLK
jgi:CRP-like cAMP-binding protein